MDKIDAVYVLCHIEKEHKRYERLTSMFRSVGIPSEKIQWIGPTWGADLTANECLGVYDPFKNSGFSFKSRCMTKGEISLGLNMLAAFKDAITKSHVLIFESDTYLRPDFCERLEQIFTDISGRPWDYVSLSTGVGSRPDECISSYYVPTKCYSPPHVGVFRCTDSMLFCGEFLKKIVPIFTPFHDAMDWHLNLLFFNLKGVALWADPPIAEQGTNFRRDTTSLAA